MIIFYVATYVACAALPFALLHKEINFTVNFTSWIWNLLSFLGCLFFGCFVFWPKKLYFIWDALEYSFFCDNSRISSWIFWWSISFDFGSNFWKKRRFFGISEISLFHFLDLEFDRISAAFCCSANSFFGGTAVFFVMILLDDESLDDDDFRWSSLVITVCLTLFPYFWRLIRQRLQVIIAEVVRLTTMIVINVRNKIPEVFVRVTQIE